MGTFILQRKATSQGALALSYLAVCLQLDSLSLRLQGSSLLSVLRMSQSSTDLRGLGAGEGTKGKKIWVWQLPRWPQDQRSFPLGCEAITEGLQEC